MHKGLEKTLLRRYASGQYAHEKTKRLKQIFVQP